MDEPSSLPAYTTIKLRLASILQNLLALTQDQKNDYRSRSIQQLLADLAEDTFRLAVFGKYNRGKSTLMNALLGTDRLPTGILPLTSVVTTVRYDSKERVLIQREGWGFAQEISLEQLPEYITENGNPGNEKQVNVAEIFLPSDILRYGFFLIDTPGFGSSIRPNTDAAEAFISRADAAIVVMSAESQSDAEDLDLLDRVYRTVGKVFVVLNKADLIPMEDRERIRQIFTERVHSQIEENAPVFVLSAREGLLATKEAQDRPSPDPGLEKLIESLLAFMATDKTGQFLRRMAERVKELLEQEQMEVLVAQHTTDKKAVLHSLQELRTRIQKQGAEEVQKLTQESSADIYNALHKLVDEWSKGVVSTFENDPSATAISDLVTHLKRNSVLDLKTLIPPYREFLETLDRFFDSLHAQQVRFVSTDQQQKRSQDTFAQRFQNRDLTSDIPLTAFEWEQPHRGFIKSLTLPWSQQARRQEFISSLDAYCNDFYQSFQYAFQEHIEGILHEFEQRVQILGDRMAQIFQQQDDPQRMTTLKELSDQLNEIQLQVEKSAEFAPAYSEGIQKKKARPQERQSKSKCILCEHLTKISFEFMRQYQYRLLTDPIERSRNAQRGGMCQFHTWMYESFGSPQGICAGYAPVLLNFADRLEAAAQRLTQNKSEFQTVLHELSHIADDCLPCQIMRSAEADELREIGNATNGGSEMATLCFPHLCAAILHNIDRPGKLEAMNNLARAMRKYGEDMQHFALKHNALRHSWTTTGERDAYLNGLMTVAAARPLSFVRKVMELDG